MPKPGRAAPWIFVGVVIEPLSAIFLPTAQVTFLQVCFDFGGVASEADLAGLPAWPLLRVSVTDPVPFVFPPDTLTFIAKLNGPTVRVRIRQPAPQQVALPLEDFSFMTPVGSESSAGTFTAGVDPPGTVGVTIGVTGVTTGGEQPLARVPATLGTGRVVRHAVAVGVWLLRRGSR